jgi:hypothetical protein
MQGIQGIREQDRGEKEDRTGETEDSRDELG